MTNKSQSAINNETPNQYSYWSVTLALVTAFVLADVFSGGLLRETISRHHVEYGLTIFTMIVTVGVYASDGSPGLKFVRACSRHKL